MSSRHRRRRRRLLPRVGRGFECKMPFFPRALKNNEHGGFDLRTSVNFKIKLPTSLSGGSQHEFSDLTNPSRLSVAHV